MDRNELIQSLSKNFHIQELVCEHCYKKFGERAWQFLSTELLSVLYTLRYVIFNKPITVNTWYNGGGLAQRGLRCNLCTLVNSKSTVYISAHILGKAIDFNVKGLDVENCKELIRQNIDKFEYPIRLESNTDTWIHIDVLQPKNSSDKLVEFNG